MSRIVLGAVALIAAGWTVSAQAADLPYGSRAPYTVNQPLNAYSWAGPYLGGNLGYDWGTVDNNPTKPSGFVGGVQAGYNWQRARGCSASRATSRPPAPPIRSRPGSSRTRGSARVRGRAGYALNNILFYGTGGLAFGELRGETFGLSETHTNAGWTPASAPKSALRRTGAPRSNISTSICPTAISPSPACQTATGSAWCAPA